MSDVTSCYFKIKWESLKFKHNFTHVICSPNSPGSEFCFNVHLNLSVLSEYWLAFKKIFSEQTSDKQFWGQNPKKLPICRGSRAPTGVGEPKFDSGDSWRRAARSTGYLEVRGLLLTHTAEHGVLAWAEGARGTPGPQCWSHPSPHVWCFPMERLSCGSSYPDGPLGGHWVQSLPSG